MSASVDYLLINDNVIRATTTAPSWVKSVLIVLLLSQFIHHRRISQVWLHPDSQFFTLSEPLHSSVWTSKPCDCSRLCWDANDIQRWFVCMSTMIMMWLLPPLLMNGRTSTHVHLGAKIVWTDNSRAWTVRSGVVVCPRHTFNWSPAVVPKKQKNLILGTESDTFIMSNRVGALRGRQGVSSMRFKEHRVLLCILRNVNSPHLCDGGDKTRRLR